ncbi:LysM peptidoglycan-binding domain-containing protein [Phaeocystidibacter luteus]|uniref:LysM peptidoglycan-binding domain-containing protein n=2 Tax=Phaeocystidibacter luteus TaxID=911197 RepID=A0A6N6RLA4_9FLAO|nr:LysM peptidoglycan-binding domain-containing protein [Phaeocystidibacter luteus]
MGINMRKWILLLLIFIGGVINAQERTHHVEKGETLYSISRTYGVTIERLIESNPFLSEGLKEGQDLVIPASDVSRTRPSLPTIDTTRFDYHTVQAGETIYSLTREWGITYERLLELNPELSEGLKVNQKLKLPKGTLDETVGDVPAVKEGFIQHNVRRGETVYSLTKSIHWPAAELYEANPNLLEEGLKAGTMVWIPDNAVSRLYTKRDSLLGIEQVAIVDTTPNDSTEVEEEEDEPVSKYMVVRTGRDEDLTDLMEKYNVTFDELTRLNPELVGGTVQPNRNIIVPRPKADTASSPLLESLEGLDGMQLLSGQKIHIAVALPLYLEENDSLAMRYNMGEALPQVYSRSRFAFDFYSGLKLAIDTLLGYGLDVEIDIYDTRNDQVRVREIAREIRENKPDVVIGPLYSQNAETLARELEDTWIVSPLSRTINNSNTPKLVQAVTPMREEHLALAKWVNDSAKDANIIFVRRINDAEKVNIQHFMQYLEASETRTLSTLEMGEDLFSRSMVRNKMAAGRRDVFVILDSDPVLLTSFINSIASLNDSSATVLCTSRLLGNKTIEIEKLNKVDLYISDVEYVDYSSPNTNSFIARYREDMGTEPPRFAYHGYDVGMYFLPLFTLNKTYETDLWGGNQGIMKIHRFTQNDESVMVNSGVFLLHLENFRWTRIY